MAVDFGRWSQRAYVGFAPTCGGHAKRRPRQSLQSDLEAVDPQRLAAALRLLLFGQPGRWRKRARDDRGE